MDKVQLKMLDNIPSREATVKSSGLGKKVACVAGLIIGGLAAYYIGPRVLRKVHIVAS